MTPSRDTARYEPERNPQASAGSKTVRNPRGNAADTRSWNLAAEWFASWRWNRSYRFSRWGALVAAREVWANRHVR